MEASIERNVAHLTDEQFAGLLMAANPPEVRSHLAACAQCMQEAERVSGAIGSFEQQSRLWAERRAATHPRAATVRQPVFPWLHRPQTWAAVALAIALAVGTGVSIRGGSARSARQSEFQAVAKVQPVTQVTPATVKADNELLSAIDGELTADESMSASAYGLDAPARREHAKPAKGTSN
jgi:hypothetical protein